MKIATSQPINILQNPSNQRTVATLHATNPHVNALPPIFLKDFETVITDLELRAHAVVLGILTAGLPSSTIPAVYKNPSFGGTGLIFGFGLGILLSYLSLHPNTSLTNFQDWAERVAAMNNPTKATGAAGYGVVISGNTLANLFAPISNPIDSPIIPISNCSSTNPIVVLSTCSINGNNLYALFQGVFAGTYAGRIFGTGIMNGLTDILNATSTTTVPQDHTKDPLITNDPNAKNIQDATLNPQTAINI